jgi:hypothetical protein
VIGEQSGGAFAQIVDEMCQRLLIEVVKHVFQFGSSRILVGENLGVKPQ